MMRTWWDCPGIVDKLLVTYTGLPASIWYQVGALVIASLAGAATLIGAGSVLLAAVAVGGVMVIATGVGILPMWTVIVYGAVAVGFVVFSRVASI